MSSKSKVFFVVGSFKGGGTERTASRIGLELLRRGYCVKFLLINYVFDYTNIELQSNSIALNPRGFTHPILRRAYILVRLFWITWKERPHRLISFSLGVNILVFFLGFPSTVFRVESNMFIYRRTPWKRYLQRIFVLFPHIHSIIIPSSGLARASRSYFWGYSKRKILQIDNPIDIDEVDRLSGIPPKLPGALHGKYFVSAGRLTVGKGFEQLIRVFRQSSLYPEYSLLILGKGTMMEKLVQLVKDLKLENHVFLIGHVENPYSFFKNAEFFILNSSHESFANVLIEAMACGTPVISNDCDFGPRHIVDDSVNGYLYDKRDEQAFIDLLSKFRNGDTLLPIKRNLRVSIQKFSVQRIVDIWQEKVL